MLIGLLEEHPEDAQANYLMASLCDQSDQERRAISFYRRALAGGAKDLPEEDVAGAYLGLGSTHRALGEHEEPDACCWKVRSGHPITRRTRRGRKGTCDLLSRSNPRIRGSK